MRKINKGLKPAHLLGEIYSDRAKYVQTKETLQKIQHNKCCYCEIICEGQLEHYFPKSVYHQHINQWKNLFLVCPECNLHKGNTFEICGTKSKNDDDFDKCFHVEKPCMVNPEKDFPECMLTFNNKCEIVSTQKENCESCKSRMEYTIKTCRLNRNFIVKQRLRVLQDLENSINAYILFGKTINIVDMQDYMKKTFIDAINNQSASFIAFRKYIVRNCLTTILSTI